MTRASTIGVTCIAALAARARSRAIRILRGVSGMTRRFPRLYGETARFEAAVVSSPSSGAPGMLETRSARANSARQRTCRCREAVFSPPCRYFSHTYCVCDGGHRISTPPTCRQWRTSAGDRETQIETAIDDDPSRPCAGGLFDAGEPLYPGLLGMRAPRCAAGRSRGLCITT